MSVVLANLVALFHGLVVLPLLVLGPFALFGVKKRVLWLERAFLVVGGLTALSFLLTRGCFLTTWEQQLRIIAGHSSYQGGFVSHYLARIGITFPDLATTIILVILIVGGFGRLAWLYKKT